MKISPQNLVEWLGSRLQKMSRYERAPGSNVEICLGNFAVGVVGKLRIETSSFVFCPRLMEVDPSVCSHSLHISPSQPISKSDTKKRIFKQSLSWRDTNEGYQSAQSPLKVHTKIEKKVEISPNLLNILQLRHREGARAGQSLAQYSSWHLSQPTSAMST